MELEKMLYEARPHIYAFFSLAAFSLGKHQASKVLFFSGVLLALSSFLVFKARSEYRNRRVRY
jgi:hypothetical protein